MKSVYILMSFVMMIAAVYAVKNPLPAQAAVIPDFVPNEEINLSMKYLADKTLPSGRFVYNANINLIY